MPATARPIASSPSPLREPAMPDWIDSFMDYTEGLPTPDIFRLWTGISTIAACLERRVWVATARGVVYPNLFVLLVAPPAVGKSIAIEQSENLMQAASTMAARQHSMGGFKLAPKDMSAASLVDAMTACTRRYITASGGIDEYSSMYIQIGELGVLMPGHDLHFVSLLNNLYDNPNIYTQQRRSLGKDPLTVTRPSLNVLAGTQPGFLAATLPEEAWNMGLTSRLILVYASSGPIVDLFSSRSSDPAHFKALAEGLAKLQGLHGLVKWSDEAATEVQKLHFDRIPPTPEHSRLQHYIGRRTLHLLKLSIIACCSRGGFEISLRDLHRARHWLLQAEELMPDIFRDMVGKSDHQVIQELHFHIWRIWAKDKKPVHESRLFDFLRTRVPSEKIEKIIEIAQRSNILKRTAGTNYYTPQPKHEHGME